MSQLSAGITEEDIVREKNRAGKYGMYDGSFEHDACGMGFVADVKGRKSRAIIDKGLDILKKSCAPRCGRRGS